MKINVEYGNRTYEVQIAKSHTYAYHLTVTAPAITELTPETINRQAIDKVCVNWKLFHTHLTWEHTEVRRVDHGLASPTVSSMFYDASYEACKLALETPDWQQQADMEWLENQIASRRGTITRLFSEIEELEAERIALVSQEVSKHLKILGA